ncbi:MAG: membrane protein insertase YidC [Pseudomonadales bacterium]|nr:membrane protein insertase YidC [Pseudomonadales bacterium]
MSKLGENKLREHKLGTYFLLVVSLLFASSTFGLNTSENQWPPTKIEDTDHLQMLIWDDVVEKYQFSGLAQYYNNVDYYLFENDVLQEIDEHVTIELSAKQWFIVVGRFNVLLVQAEGLIVRKSDSLIMTENTEILSRLSSTVKILSKPELEKLSPAFDILRYHHLWFGFAEIAKLVEAVLVFIQTKLIGNWGLVLFVFAILVKLILLPLSIFTAKLQRRVSEVQSKLAPKLKDIKSNYDGEEAHNLLMAAHKELGVSPFYSLKPLVGPLVQIPILIGIFNALGEMPHFQESTFFWIQNLAYPDSVGSLPISIPMFGLDVSLLPGLMTAVTIISTVLFSNSKASEEELSKQKRNLYLMAAAFFLLFYPFPAVMVLYWTYSNILHIAQQKVVKI